MIQKKKYLYKNLKSVKGIPWATWDSCTVLAVQRFRIENGFWSRAFLYSNMVQRFIPLTCFICGLIRSLTIYVQQNTFPRADAKVVISTANGDWVGTILSTVLAGKGRDGDRLHSS